MKGKEKSVAALAVPVFSSLLIWATSGTLNTPELATALAGLFAGLMVYLVPNSEPTRRNDHQRS